MFLAQLLHFYTPQIGRGDSQGGVGVSADRICQHLATIGELHVITGAADIPPLALSSSARPGYTRHELGHHPDRTIWRKGLYDFICQLHDNFTFHVAIAFYIDGDAFPMTLFAEATAVPLYSFCRGNDVHLGCFNSDAYFLSRTLQGSKFCICPSRELQNQVSVFCPTAKTYYLPNSVDTKTFSPSNRTSYAPKERKTVGIFGDLKHKKGLPLLLESLDFDRFDLRIVGQLRPDMQKMLHGFLCLNDHLMQQIHLSDRINNIQDLIVQYENCDIVCVPSLYDGMPNVLLEAMALGKICVCSATGGAVDVIVDGENGFLFRHMNAEHLQATLHRVLNLSPQDQQKIGVNARTTVSNRYSLERELSELHSLLNAKISQEFAHNSGKEQD